MNSKHLSPIFLMLLMSISLISCNSDDSSDSGDSSTVIAQLETSIKSGSWQVTNFVEDGNNQTSNFSGYVFTFEDNGTVTATNGSTTKNGTWNSGTDDSTPKFIMNFSDNNGPFEEISEDWRIENTTASKIDLKHVSGGDGSVDLLTFTKI